MNENPRNNKPPRVITLLIVQFIPFSSQNCVYALSCDRSTFFRLIINTMHPAITVSQNTASANLMTPPSPRHPIYTAATSTGKATAILPYRLRTSSLAASATINIRIPVFIAILPSKINPIALFSCILGDAAL